MNPITLPSARSIFEHQRHFGTASQATLRSIRHDEHRRQSLWSDAWFNVPLVAGASCLTLTSGGGLAPILALPIISLSDSFQHAAQKPADCPRDAQVVNSVDVRFGALGRIDADTHRALVDHLVAAKILSRESVSRCVYTYYLRTTDRLEAVLQSSAQFRNLDTSSQHQIITYFKRVHEVAPMVRAMRDLHVKLSHAIADKDAVLASVISGKITDFQARIEQELEAIDHETATPSRPGEPDLIAL